MAKTEPMIPFINDSIKKSRIYNRYAFEEGKCKVAMLGGSLVTMAWRVLKLRMEGSPPGTEVKW
jgi:hypothetical protein